MNVVDIRTLYTYNDWATKRLLDVTLALSRADLARDLGASHKSVKGTLVHILWAEWIWLQRWRGQSPKVVFLEDAYADLESIASQMRDVAREQHEFIDSLNDDLLLARQSYLNLQGEQWEYTLGHMMQHVVNHSTYHRGQLVTLLRQLGCPAAPTDFLVFFDELGPGWLPDSGVRSIAAEHSAINRVRETLVAAVNRSDAEAASQLWTDDGRMMPPNQPTLHGRVAIHAHFAHLFTQRQFRYTLTNCEPHISGNMAVERVEYHVITRSIGDGSVAEDSGKGLHVYRRDRDGRWQLLEDIWNSDPVAPGDHVISEIQETS